MDVLVVLPLLRQLLVPVLDLAVELLLLPLQEREGRGVALGAGPQGGVLFLEGGEARGELEAGAQGFG